MYAPDYFLAPSFLQAGLTGDALQDITIAVVEKATKKKGVLVMHARSDAFFVFGAGTKFGNGSDDFARAKAWRTYTGKTASETLFDKDDNIIGR